MPVAASRLCAEPGCPDLAVHRSRCAAHNLGSSTHQGYGPAWRKLRAVVLAEEPYCRECPAPSNEVDHIRPKRKGGTDARDNLQALCKPCHSRKTAKEGWGRG